MKKLIVLILLLIGLLNLSGCGNNENNYLKINFDKFILYLDSKNDWININPSTITNTQIVEKLVKVLKNKSNKNLNIIISKTEIKRNDIDFKTFINANLEKFNKIVGYKFEKLETSEIECGKEEIPIGIHFFEIDQSFLNNQQKKYYYSQIYIFMKTYGYIIQVFSQNQEDVNKLTKKIIDNLKCKNS